MEGLDEEQMDMMKLMGFANFDTTKVSLSSDFILFVVSVAHLCYTIILHQI